MFGLAIGIQLSVLWKNEETVSHSGENDILPLIGKLKINTALHRFLASN